MGVKLVIVDDAPFIREVVRHIIEDTKIELAGEAANGEEAVKVVLNKKPDVVLMDIVMPVKSGIDATTEILEKRPKTKIIACTTEGQKAMVMKAMNAGCCDFVAKPFKKEALVNAVMGAMKKK